MAEPVIGGLGLLGLIALFQTCSSAYDTFCASRDRAAEAAAVGSVSGHLAGQQCRLLRSETEQTQKTVVIMLEAIKTHLEEIRTIMFRYDSRIGETGHHGAEPTTMTTTTTTDLNLELNLQNVALEDVEIENSPALIAAKVMRRETESFVKTSTTRLRKIKWALGDGAKLNKLIEDLRLINENLWVVLPVNKWLALAKGLPSLVLPGISDTSVLSEVEDSARNGTTTKLLAACVDLRRAALAAESSGDGLAEQHLHRPVDCVIQKAMFGDADRRATGPRAIASIRDQDGITRSIIIEWRSVDRNRKEPEKEVIRSNIKALAIVLSSTKSSELGLLRCIGFFKEDHLFGENYALLLEIPRTPNQQTVIPPQVPGAMKRPQSLYEYMQATSHAPPLLGDRFQIAATLCSIVLQIHASNWLHKAIRPSNILFLNTSTDDSNASSPRLAQPYLVGFDFSRPDRPSAESLEQPSDKTENGYLHPALWPSKPAKIRPRFRKEFDIFALGVVLLEIGNWKLAHLAAEKEPARQHFKNSQAWKAFLLDCTGYLGYRCGKIYQEVVETCLSGPFDEKSGVELDLEPGVDVQDIKRSFLIDVIYQLAKCNV